MNCSLHQVFGAGAFLRLEKTKQEQITCVTSTLTKSTQIWLQAEQHEHLFTVHLSEHVSENSQIEWRCSKKRSDALMNGEQRQTSPQWPANPEGETRMIEKKTKLPPSTSLMIPDETFQILFKEAKRRKMSVSALLLEECQSLAVKYSKAGA